MLERLNALLEPDDEDEEPGRLAFRSATVTEDGLSIRLEFIPVEDGPRRTWRIECSGVRDYSLRGDCWGPLAVARKHPVLLPFTAKRSRLSFSSAPPDPLATVGALWEMHRRFAGDWIPFIAGNLEGLLRGGFGYLASGPAPLLRRYEAILRQHGMKTHRQVSGSACEAQPPVALLFGPGTRSYVVAARFEEHEEPPPRRRSRDDVRRPG